MSVAPDSLDDVRADLKKGLARLSDTRPEYDRREQYQLGKRMEISAHPKLKGLLEKYGEHFKLNYAGVPARALNDRMDLLALRTGDESADTLLSERFWMPNALDEDADDIHLKAAYLGDYYGILEVVDSEEDLEDEDGETSTGLGTVELTPKDPRTTVIIYQRSNSRIPDFGVQVVNRGGGEFNAYVYYDDEVWRFVTKEGSSKESDGLQYDDYIVDLPIDEEGLPVPIEGDDGGFPILHWRPDSRPYGTPVNLDAYGPQDSITKLVATLMASVDYHGLPERYALLDPTRETGDDMARDFNDDFPEDGTTPATEAKGKAKTDSRPGGTTFLDGVKETGSYDTADPNGFTGPMGTFIRAAATLTRTPLYEFDLEGSGDQPSGEARRRADVPITKHASKLQGQHGNVWAAAGKWVLRSLGQTSTKRVQAIWAPVEAATDKEGIELVGLKVENGVPVRQALAEAGYTAEQLEKWYGPEAEGAPVLLSPKLLGLIGTALVSLGQARGLGSINPEDIADALAQWWPNSSTPEADPAAGQP